jgi:hypothetical protein
MWPSPYVCSWRQVDDDLVQFVYIQYQLRRSQEQICDVLKEICEPADCKRIAAWSHLPSPRRCLTSQALRRAPYHRPRAASHRVRSHSPVRPPPSPTFLPHPSASRSNHSPPPRKRLWLGPRRTTFARSSTRGRTLSRGVGQGGGGSIAARFGGELPRVP